MWIFEAIKLMRRTRAGAQASNLGLTVLFCGVLGLFGWYLFSSTPTTTAAIGDYAIYRGTSVESYGTTPTEVTWNVTQTEGTGFSIDGGETTVTLEEAGHYFVMYDLALETSGGSNRSEIQGRIKLDDWEMPYGRGTCTIRRTDNINFCIIGAAAIFEATSTNQELKIEAVRTDSNTATVARQTSGSALTLVRLDNLTSYARIYTTGTPTSNSATYTPLVWDVEEEMDSAVFSRSGADITLADAGMYLVTSNVKFSNSSTDRRTNTTRLTLDGYEVEGTRVSAFLRGSDSLQDHAASFVGLIRATTTNQVLRLEHNCATNICGNITITPGETGMSIVKLRDEAEVVRLHESGGGQALDGTLDPILWDTQEQVDASFTHSTTSSSSRIILNEDGDYLFFGSFYSDTGQTALSHIRLLPLWQWRTNGASILNYGGFSRYKRGNQNPHGFTVGKAAGALIENLNASDYVELVNTDLALDDDALATFNGDRYAVQGVRLDTLFVKDVTVSTLGTQRATTTLPETDVALDARFVLTANREDETVTGITLTENGTINAQTALDNIELYYELDTTNPYNCVGESYGGGETQFGATDTNGFSGPDGTSDFTDSVDIATTSAMCVYVVLDVSSNANNGETIELEITNPQTDVTLVSATIDPGSVVALGGDTVIQDEVVTQTRYHWRNDDGSESSASSATGGIEDTPISSLSKGVPKRLRLQVSNEGLATAGSAQFRLEYAPIDGTCAATSGWVDVGAVAGAWDMSPSSNLTEGGDTTDISTTTGGVTNENDNFLTPNGGVRESSSQTGSLTLSGTDFVELEYSVVALSGAGDGTTYCFRATDAGTALSSYAVYPEVTISADVRVSATSTQVATLEKNSVNNVLGGVFSIVERINARDVTEVTISETGTVDGNVSIENLRLYYELDTSDPYTCAGETYGGSEQQYGATSTSGFSGANGSATFTETVGISTTSTLCLYTVFDINNSASNAETIEVEISDASGDVVVSGGGTVAPDIPEALPGSTSINGEVLDLFAYHWRNDDGDEATSTSQTAGVENTPISNVLQGEKHRLRIGIDNTGAATSSTKEFRLEYGIKAGTCAAVGTWYNIADAGGNWEMIDSINLSEGGDTTDVAPSLGGITNPVGQFFVGNNNGVKDASSQTGSLLLADSEFVELEFSIEPTNLVSFSDEFCFRVTNAGTPLENYSVYPEAQIRPNQDFYVQRGTFAIPNGSSTYTLDPTSEYTPPSDSSRAFIRMTNTQHTGAGNTSGAAVNLPAQDVTAYISDPADFTNGIEFARYGNTGDTRISWELIEYIGPVEGDNEMIVRSAEVVEFGSGDTLSSTATIGGVDDDADIVVFVTGQGNSNIGNSSYNTGLVTAEWNATSSVATLTRGEAGGDAISTSIAVVEFVGSNWNIQRVEHTYVTNSGFEDEPVSAVIEDQTFLHLQKRVGGGLDGLDEFAHEVYLSSSTTVSFRLHGTAGTPAQQTSVAWVIENVQTSGTPMQVWRSNGSSSGGATNPLAVSVSIGGTVASLNNTTIHTVNRVSGTARSFPRAIIGVRLISNTNYELWFSNNQNIKTYRTEVVEWPTASRSFVQNYFRFYVDNGALDPTVPWPASGPPIGENAGITALDEPPTAGGVVRLRMSVQVNGGVLSSGFQQFRLQTAARGTSTCSALTNWLNVGDPGSTTALWVGQDASPVAGTALSGDPPSAGALNLSVSDRAGTYEEGVTSASNPFRVAIGEDIEYDWSLKANSVVDTETYCFRMVESDGSLLTQYNYYPTVAVAGFNVVTENWQWFDDETQLTPSVSLAPENSAPSDVEYANPMKLRITVSETAGSSGPVKYRLQYSTEPDFSANVAFVASQDDCVEGTSTWCYFEGAGEEHQQIDESVLTDSDTCTGGSGLGCGTHNEYPFVPTAIGEVGTVSTDAGGTTVNLQNTFVDPVIILESVSGDSGGGSGNDPAVAVITGTTSTSFDVRIQEPDNEADDHGVETFSYLVMEKGTYTDKQSGEVLFDAQVQSVSDYYGNAVAGTSDDVCSFGGAFSASPVVLSGLQSDFNTGTPDFLTASVLSVSPTQFLCSLEVPDGESNTPSLSELYGWIAFRPSPTVFKNNLIPMEVLETPQSVQGWTDTPWYAHEFDQDNFETLTPNIIGTRQTRDGAEGGWVRYEVVSSSTVRVAVDERDDGERTHTNETVGLLGFVLDGATTTLIHSTDPTYQITGNAFAEHEFTIRHAGALPNQTYYFRLFDWVTNEPVVASSSYPSLVTEGASLTLTTSGITAGATTEGVMIDVTTTATSVDFGDVPLGSSIEAAQRIAVSMNGLEGYQVFLYEDQELSSGQSTIQEVNGTNASPLPWSSACQLGTTTGCWGYHVGDNTLANGSTRFLLDDTYAAITTSPEEVAYVSGPASGEETEVIFRLEINNEQPAGDYRSSLVYIIVPVF